MLTFWPSNKENMCLYSCFFLHVIIFHSPLQLNMYYQSAAIPSATGCKYQGTLLSIQLGLIDEIGKKVIHYPILGLDAAPWFIICFRFSFFNGILPLSQPSSHWLPLTIIRFKAGRWGRLGSRPVVCLRWPFQRAPPSMTYKKKQRVEKNSLKSSVWRNVESELLAYSDYLLISWPHTVGCCWLQLSI